MSTKRLQIIINDMLSVLAKHNASYDEGLRVAGALMTTIIAQAPLESQALLTTQMAEAITGAPVAPPLGGEP